MVCLPLYCGPVMPINMYSVYKKMSIKKERDRKKGKNCLVFVCYCCYTATKARETIESQSAVLS